MLAVHHNSIAVNPSPPPESVHTYPLPGAVHNFQDVALRVHSSSHDRAALAMLVALAPVVAPAKASQLCSRMVLCANACWMSVAQCVGWTACTRFQAAVRDCLHATRWLLSSAAYKCSFWFVHICALPPRSCLQLRASARQGTASACSMCGSGHKSMASC